MAEIQLVSLYQRDRSRHAEALRRDLAVELGATVGAPDGSGLFVVEVRADSPEEALARVRDAVAAVDGDDHLQIVDAGQGAGEDLSDEPPDETRRPTWLEGAEMPERRRLADDEVPDPPNDLEGPEEEPPHVERGSPWDDRPEPYDPPPRDIP